MESGESAKSNLQSELGEGESNHKTPVSGLRDGGALSGNLTGARLVARIFPCHLKTVRKLQIKGLSGRCEKRRILERKYEACVFFKYGGNNLSRAAARWMYISSFQSPSNKSTKQIWYYRCLSSYLRIQGLCAHIPEVILKRSGWKLYLDVVNTA